MGVNFAVVIKWNEIVGVFVDCVGLSKAINNCFVHNYFFVNFNKISVTYDINII
jgi:hypothetical protein